MDTSLKCWLEELWGQELQAKKEGQDSRKLRKPANSQRLVVTKGSLGYLSSMYFSTSLVLGEVVGPFPETESWKQGIST